jgi:RNA polymerase sigma-70 factor (ECF subfamily)
MQELPEVDRAALLMRAQEGMSYEEIAHALDLSLAAVKVKIHRARQRLMHATRARDEKG